MKSQDRLAAIPASICEETLALGDINGMDLVAGLAVALRVARANAGDDLHAGDDLAENRMFAIQVRRGLERDEELRAIGVGSRVRHRQNPWAVVLKRQRAFFIGKFIAGTAHPRAGGVASLRHEAGNDAMEGCSIVKMVPRQKDEIVDGHRSLFREKLDREITLVGVKHRCVLLGGINHHIRHLVVLLGHRHLLLP